MFMIKDTVSKVADISPDKDCNKERNIKRLRGSSSDDSKTPYPKYLFNAGETLFTEGMTSNIDTSSQAGESEPEPIWAKRMYLKVTDISDKQSHLSDKLKNIISGNQMLESNLTML